MSTMRRLITALVLTLAPASGMLSGQEVVDVGRERCERCTIAVVRELVIGDDEGGGIIERRASWVRRGPGGEYLVVAQAGSANAISVFDSLGRFVKRVGVAGQGPEEFQDIVGIHVNPDRTVAVFDRVNMRLSMWSPRFEAIDTRRLQVLLGNDVLYFPDGSIVTNGRQPTPDGVGVPVLRMDSTGRRTNAFNAHRDRYLATEDDRARRRLAMSGDTAFWSAHLDTYELHLWDLNGNLLRTLRGSVPWFGSDGVSAGEPSPPRLVGLREESGILWMLVLVPDRDWRDAVTPGGHPRGYSIDDEVGYRDAILHAVDAETGTILGEHRFDAPVFNFVDGGHVAFVEEDGELIPRMVIAAFRVAF